MNPMEIHQILQYLPHRYPFLLVDRVLSCEPGKEITALKNVDRQRTVLRRAFSPLQGDAGRPDRRGDGAGGGDIVVQDGGAKADANSVYYFVGIDNARFKKPVTPGDQLVMTVRLERQVRGIWKYDAEARVADVLVAEASLMCTMRDISAIVGQ